MPRLPKQPQLAQLKLFHPLVKSPNWYVLPLEVRQQTPRLLARLLREAAARDRAASQAGGLGDETAPQGLRLIVEQLFNYTSVQFFRPLLFSLSIGWECH